MTSLNTRSRSAQQTPTKRQAPKPTEQEMQLLNSYVFGDITLEEANELLLLHQNGRFIIAICTI